MSKEEIFNVDPESSSDEEDPTIDDDDTCSAAELETAFPIKYSIASEAIALDKKFYILQICADKSFGRIVTGLSNNSVQIFDINSQTLFRPNVDGIQLNREDGIVCGVRFLDETPNNLLVGSSKNGTVSLCDLRTGKMELLFQDPDKALSITAFDLNANGRVICSGTDQLKSEVHLQFFDVRQTTQMGVYFESHEDDVTDVKFHPTNPDLLCTGSVDGLINLFDISAASEDDALISTVNTESSVDKLNWHKNVYEKDVISCITQTCDLHTYECGEGDLIAKFERSQITEAIKRKSVACCDLVSCHNLADGGMFLVSSSNFNNGEALRSVQVQGKKLKPHALFDGNNQIVRGSVFDAKSNMLVTGGESGVVTLWSPVSTQQPPQPAAAGPNKLKAKAISTKKHRSVPY